MIETLNFALFAWFFEATLCYLPIRWFGRAKPDRRRGAFVGLFIALPALLLALAMRQWLDDRHPDLLLDAPMWVWWVVTYGPIVVIVPGLVGLGWVLGRESQRSSDGDGTGS